MFKKITSLILVFLLSCLTPITAFSAAAPLLVEENDVSSTQDDRVPQTLEERMALHPEIAIIAEKNNIDPEAINISYTSQEYLDAYYGAPDDVLSSSTLELLVYFIKNTAFMVDNTIPEIFAASPDLAEIAKNKKTDFTRHEAFRELISRDDFIDALDLYAASLTQLTYDDDPFDQGKKAIEKILEQSTVEALLSAPAYDAADHPNLQRIRGTSDAVTTSDENDVSALKDENQFTDSSVNINETIIPENDQLLFDSEYVITVKVDSDYAKWLCSASDEILSASTIELLEYFIQTPFMGQNVYPEVILSSVDLIERARNMKVDYTQHEAFRELISRDDFIDALELYAASLTQLTYDDDPFDQGKKAIEKILEQSTVEVLLSAPTYDAADHPNIQRIRGTSDAVTTSVNEYASSTDNIYYYSAGTISTVNGRDVEVCTPNRELTSSEITGINNFINNSYDFAGNTRIAEPTTVYNCHSYAWYQYSTDNPYWIMDISEFLLDEACTEVIPKSTVQVKDIIVYYNSQGAEVHSGVVYSISSSGEVTICSKWGRAGVYLHSINNVPDGYLADPGNETASYAFFRYHDYTNRYTGDEYHSGSQHYFRYADICDICGKETNETWITVDCMGPPCYVPWSLGTVVSRSKYLYKL